MQNRYTGDIGDFSKLGLLRVLQASDLSIGLNWYLTPDEKHNDDGKHVKYLEKDEYRSCDEDLWLELKDIVDSDHRAIEHLENENTLKATYFSECLNFSGMRKSERLEFRSAWHKRALVSLSDLDVITVDPDNGLIVPSAVGMPKENKYVMVDELADYYARGSTVIYYQHKARKRDPHYINQHNQLINSGKFPGASGLALKFKKTSQRYYFFIIQPRHKETIETAVNGMMETPWKKHFCLLDV